MGLFNDIGFYSHGVVNITPRESFDLCNKGAIIIDVRETYMSSFKMFRVENVVYLPFSDLESSFNVLPKEKLLIIADAVGLKSREAVIFLKKEGFENVVNMAGGIVDWERDGMPVTTDKSFRLSGSCMCQLKLREKNK